MLCQLISQLFQTSDNQSGQQGNSSAQPTAAVRLPRSFHGLQAFSPRLQAREESPFRD